MAIGRSLLVAAGSTKIGNCVVLPERLSIVAQSVKFKVSHDIHARATWIAPAHQIKLHCLLSNQVTLAKVLPISMSSFSLTYISASELGVPIAVVVQVRSSLCLISILIRNFDLDMESCSKV